MRRGFKQEYKNNNKKNNNKRVLVSLSQREVVCVRWELAERGVKNASVEHLVDPAGDAACAANHDTEKLRLNVKKKCILFKEKIFSNFMA